MSHNSPKPLSRRVRASIVMSISLAFLGLAPTAMAASPRDQAYTACANGYEGNPGDCKRICGSYLKQGNNPLGDMKGTCLRRVNEKKSNGVPPPD